MELLPLPLLLLLMLLLSAVVFDLFVVPAEQRRHRTEMTGEMDRCLFFFFFFPSKRKRTTVEPETQSLKTKTHESLGSKKTKKPGGGEEEEERKNWDGKGDRQAERTKKGGRKKGNEVRARARLSCRD